MHPKRARVPQGVAGTITAAQEKGAKVSREDWVFPNWDPTKD
jgi:hypothetical protein